MARPRADGGRSQAAAREGRGRPEPGGGGEGESGGRGERGRWRGAADDRCFGAEGGDGRTRWGQRSLRAQSGLFTVFVAAVRYVP